MLSKRIVSLCAALVLAACLEPAVSFADAGSAGADARQLAAGSTADMLGDALATQAEDEAKAQLDAARAAQVAAQAAVDADEAVPVPTENKEAWTALGLFKHIRDHAAANSAEYWDAQCAIDILTGGKNTTGHAYGAHEGPVPDGYGATQWSNISSKVILADRGDAVALDNVKQSLAYIDQFNATRKRHNQERGTSLSTTVGTNCRQMAVSIVQADASRDYTVGHTQAYAGAENLHWGRGFDPFKEWYDEERSLADSGVTDTSRIGHYLTIIDQNGGSYAALVGFAVVTSSVPAYGTCNELSLYSRFASYPGYVPAPSVSYSTDEFRSKYFDDYYQAQVQDGMNGVPAEVKAAHRQALEEAEAATQQAEVQYLAAYSGAASVAGFKDLRDTAWYMSAEDGVWPGTKTLYLDYTIKRGLMSGFSATTFGPDGNLSRAMAATIIYRMAKGDEAKKGSNNVKTKFKDVPPGRWYTAAVAWCAENGIVTGYTGSGTFDPDGDVTREQLVTMIGRYCEKIGHMSLDVDNALVFYDWGEVHTWARTGVTFCSAKGIVSGVGSTGLFMPGGKASRCQMAKIIAVTAHLFD